MTFRHPLRNDWDRLKVDFEAARERPGREGAIARAMLAMVPPFLDAIERERDLVTAPRDRLDALFVVIGMLLENAIETSYRSPHDRRAALNAMLARLEGVIAPRLSKAATVSKGGLILPGGV